MNLQDALRLAFLNGDIIYQTSNPNWVYKFEGATHNKTLKQTQRYKMSIDSWDTEAQFEEGMFSRNDWVTESTIKITILEKLEEIKRMILK